jgi:hypothetical protein
MPPNVPSAGAQRTGILVVRVWLEQDAPGRLRARLTQAVDLAEAPASLARQPMCPGICAAVEAWLRQFLDSQER